MVTIIETSLRKFHRDFKGKVSMMKNTPLDVLEQMFRECYDESIELFIRTEKEKDPTASEKEILIKLYSISEKLKGRKYIK